MFKVICIFGHVLTVNNRCYGRCYVKKLIPLCTFLKFHAHVEVNSARLFRNVFNNCSRVLNLVFSRKSNFSCHKQQLLGGETPVLFSRQTFVSSVTAKSAMCKGLCRKDRNTNLRRCPSAPSHQPDL